MLSRALMVVQLIPAIIEVVQAVEKMLPETGLGAEKLAMVRSMLTAAYNGLEDAWPSIEKVVGVIVEFANKLGVFKKGA
jgi:hypothetical protein